MKLRTILDASMEHLDKSNVINYIDIQNQMRAMYKKLDKIKKSKTSIFNEMTEKIHKATLQDYLLCQIIVSYFIQRCEVFDAITE